ncbi:hypothetical protein SESBI_03383 [Sesbania bispinosa]|nr:hypothetical protein SESBI_03383 [Sesbania bispinosa]
MDKESSKLQGTSFYPQFLLNPSPKPIHEDQDPLPGSNSGRSLYAGKACSGGEHLVYISNPIYENDESLDSGVTNTPFVTPDTSPSRLERSSSSGEDEATEADQVKRKL